eukprot:CAMPEP_0198155152 /NCGR_PEP_ID=MMETSP1443-20131203/68981_1 /TAXON_ID=186043 /ORGANISM="Entomoneis sp., Strain CCMP2396" /LENGTH=495 /DNA_ID=CAMNT_0043821893 /DNA_START=1779 /DNA_END=3266 /DNA_ORIENTATION=-
MDYLNLPWTTYYSQSQQSQEAVVDVDTESLYYVWSLALTVVFTVAVYSFEGILDERQKGSYKKTLFPKELEATVAAIDQERLLKKKQPANNNKNNDTQQKDDDESKPLLPQLQDKFKNAQAYGLDKINFGMFASTYDVVESVAFLLMGFLPFTWDLAAKWGDQYFGWSSEEEHEIKITLVFMAIVTVVGTITSLPFELYSTFGIERKHGFNKQTLGLFLSDKIKSLALTCIIGGPFVALLLWIIKAGGEYFYIYVWGFLTCFSLIMMTIVPTVIMPMFNKYEPLPEGTLKTRVFALADQLKYPLTKLFVMDGSKRSAHSNAFMFGFGSNRRIVLFDTLLTQVKEDEILAILGHELGHWKLGHTLSNFWVTQIYFGAAFYFFSLTFGATDLYAAFGFTKFTPTIVALLLFFQTLWAPVDKLLSFFLTIFSRHNEFAADEFSVNLEMSQVLQSGLCKIHLENLGAMCPDPWYSMYHYSHPPLVERLAAMMALDRKRK